MKNICFLIFIVFLTYCQKPKANIFSIENNKIKLKIYYSKKDSINLFMDSLIIRNDRDKYQTLNLVSFDIMISTSNLENILTFNKDFNFDGYNDIEIYRPDLSGYNSLSNHFLFNKESGNYETNLSLDSIYNIELLVEKKELCSKWHAGLSAFYLTKYNWQKNKLNIVNKLVQSNSIDGKIYLTIIEKNKIISKDSIIAKSFVDSMMCN